MLSTGGAVDAPAFGSELTAFHVSSKRRWSAATSNGLWVGSALSRTVTGPVAGGEVLHRVARPSSEAFALAIPGVAAAAGGRLFWCWISVREVGFSI